MKANYLYGLVILVSLWMPKKSFSQECEFYYPIQEGTQLTIKSYDGKDKLTATIKQKIVNKEETAKGTSIRVSTSMYDKKDELQHEGEMTVKCENGKFYFDMRNYLSSFKMDDFKDMEMDIEGEDLMFPAELNVGDQLPDGSISIKIQNSGMTIMNLEVTIRNRQVAAKESITTPAGTFECYKITSEVESKTMFKVVTKNIEWVAKDIGVVRSESYDSKDKLTGYNELVDIQK